MHSNDVHRMLQEQLLTLYECGVLLLTCSRNDEESVLAAWPTSDFCLLQPHHFVAHCFGWSAKSQRLRDFAAAVGIAHEHLLFIDDMAIERAGGIMQMVFWRLKKL